MLSNEFVSVYKNPSYDDSMSSVLEIMTYCAEADPQAKRVLHILVSFRAAVADVRTKFMDLPALPIVVGSQQELRDPVSSLTSSRSASRKNSLVTVPSHPPRPGGPPLEQLLNKTESPSSGIVASGGGQGSVAGVSPVSSGSLRDADGTEGELDFEHLWNPGATGAASIPVGDGLGGSSMPGTCCAGDVTPQELSGYTTANTSSVPAVATLYSPAQFGI